MENEYTEPTIKHPNTLVISSQIESFLLETIKWGKFLAILGFIFSGLIVFIGIIVMAKGSAFSQIPALPSGMNVSIGIFYILLSLIYFFPSRFIYNFSSHLKIALFTNDQEALTRGFENLKSNFKFWGISTIVMIIFYILIIVGVIASVFINAH